MEFERLLKEYLSTRRDFVKYSSYAGMCLAVSPSVLAVHAKGVRYTTSGQALNFTGVVPSPRTEDSVRVPNGFKWEAVIKWGDPLFNDTPGIDFTDARNQSIGTPKNVERQKKAFGYNNDFLGIVKTKDGKYILLVNHEYTNAEVMFPSINTNSPREYTEDEVKLLMEAHGVSVVEIRRKQGGGWEYVRGSSYNRRISATTPIEIGGPLKGHDRMKTSRNPNGDEVLGTLNNCAGGITPWGTMLTCEENFHSYFAGDRNAVPDTITKSMMDRYGVPSSSSSSYQFHRVDNRFDVAQEPNECHRFGYVVEIDPMNPNKKPVKRTALGRFRHEGATCAVAPNGKVVVYSGDDARGEYIYKFITKGTYNPNNREANWGLLDEGALYVAKFETNGGRWIHLAFSEKDAQGNFTARLSDELRDALQAYINKSNNPEDRRQVAQAMLNDPKLVFLYTRFAADVVGATKMERPEDIEWNPITKSAWGCMTYDNTKAYTNPVNTRTPDFMGYILEIKETNGDPSSLTFTWDVPIFCGIPQHADQSKRLIIKGQDAPASYPPISAPDNLTFDSKGRVWIATDGNPSSSRLGLNDGVYVYDPRTGELKAFMFGPAGSEICGPLLSDDENTFFCAIQHPGERSSVSDPSSLFPYDGTPIPRPSVIAIYRA